MINPHVLNAIVHLLLKPMHESMQADALSVEGQRAFWHAVMLEAMERRDKATREAAGIKDG